MIVSNDENSIGLTGRVWHSIESMDLRLTQIRTSSDPDFGPNVIASWLTKRS